MEPITEQLPPPLDIEICRRARLSRDHRFDGEFFLGVSSTGIYCRPICPARLPAEKNVQYFRLASQAAAAGYRPCLRCRPEAAPGSPAWHGTATTVQRALGLIRDGALNEGSLDNLASRLGVGERYLRKLFQRELGISPQAVALNQRLLFAKQLLAETDMPITEVAFAAGFGSVRRFNSAVREHFRLTPGQLRGRGKASARGTGIRLQLQYRPPYDWEGVIDFFRRHAVDGVETVEDGCYRRQAQLAGQAFEFTVQPLPQRPALQLTVSGAGHGQLQAIVGRVRRMFDLDANPMAIGKILGADPLLGPLWATTPGVRAPGFWSLFEAAVRAIVGQQVSTAAARGICSRFAQACPGDGFPTAAGLAALQDEAFPMPGRRRATLQTLAANYSGQEDQLDLPSLAAMTGVGPWTVAMTAMRGAADPNQFPTTDLGLVRAWETQIGDRPLQQYSERWRPWRTYAANLLWRSLS